MEDFRNIADETFPSFLANSLNSNTSGILENVTISSNLGLPVAASTVARNKTGCDNRLSDIQASYLEEGRFSLPSASSHSGQSASEPRGKLALSFQGDLGVTTLITEAQPVSDGLKESNLIQRGHNQNAIAECSSLSQDTLFDILPIEHLEDLSIGICSLPQSKKENQIGPPEPGEKISPSTILSDHFSTSLSGFLENEKLLSLASLEGNSTDDDIDDEEFYDNQLEAYFKQLVSPEVPRGDCERQELSECSTALKLPENGLKQENFQVPHIHQAATGMDSATASDEDSHELEKAGHTVQREPFFLPKMIGETDQPSFRPGLEGNSSDETSVGTVANNSKIEYSQSAEDQVIGPSVTGNGCGFGDLGSGSEGAALVPLFPPNMQSFDTGGIGRNITGEENEVLDQASSKCMTLDDIPTHNEDAINGEDVLNSINVAEFKLDSLYLQHMVINKTVVDLSDAILEQRTQFSNLCHAFSSDAEEVLHLTDEVFVYDSAPQSPVNENAAVTDTNPVDECELGLADTYLSPTAGGRANEYQDAAEEVNSAFYDLDDPPHSVVYQNEEGKWVTDLAYYTSFDKEQDLNLPADNKISEDFITASEAIAKIAQDQEEFERDHRFLQEEKIDTHNTSEVEDTSWKSANSYNLLKASQTTSDLSKDASYLRLSLGEFFGQRSEALGCLGGGSDVRRPSFGYHITSPEKRQPVALLRQSDASRGNSEQESSQISDTFFPEVIKVHTREYPDSVSATFTVDEMETTAGINKSINTQTATESKIEERLDKSKSEDKLPDFTDPILSISTIASAIANASASADPSQLAAMIMALSNKSREKPFLPEADKYTDLSFINQLLSSKKEKHNAFNMEKYLKKTEEAGHESEPENFTRSDVSVHDLIWDSSLPYKHKSQDTQAADLLNSNLPMKQGGGKWLLDYTESFYEENGTQDSSCASNFPENRKKTVNRAKHSEKSSDLITGKQPQPKRTSLTLNVLGTEKTSSENERQGFLSVPATKKEMVCIGKCASLKQFASQTNSLTNSHINYSNENKETTHQVMNKIVPRSSNDSVKRATTESTVSTNSLKLVQQSSIPLPTSPTKAKSTQKLSKDEKRQGGKMQKGIQEASATYNNFVKHVTFEKPSVTSPKSIDQKPTSSECDLQSSEDEQYSFRPSTSPLIHSSPSEASGTTLSGSEADSPCIAPYFQSSACNDSTLIQSVCSSPSMSRLTYVSATDNTLKNIAIIPSAARREEDSEAHQELLKRVASSLSLQAEEVEEPSESLFNILSASVPGRMALPLQEGVAKISNALWQTPASLPPISKRAEQKYFVPAKGHEYLYTYPAPNSLVVELVNHRERPKGGIRPTLDLRGLNQYMVKLKFHVVSLASIIPSLDPGDWYAALDLQDAYFHIHIFKGQTRFLHFTVGQEHYQFPVLLFGLSTAPRVFTKCMSVVVAYLRRRGVQIFPYLDDWLVKGSSQSQVRDHVVLLLSTSATLGLLVNDTKSTLVPSNNASELSTTIIRSSPTPLVEQTTEKPEDFSWQRNRRGTSLNTSQKNVNEKPEASESTSPSNKLEDSVPNHKLSRECLPRSENEFTSSLPNTTPSQNEMGHVNPALPSKSCVLQPLSINVDTPVAWQDHTNKTKKPGLSSLNMVPTYSALGVYIPLNQNTCGEQYVPISSFKSYGSASETQTVSSAIPTLLTGRSLATTAFAQQYLGNMQSSGNVALSQYGGSCTGYCLPPGLPFSSIPAGHIQNSVTVGIPLGPSVGPGLLGTSSLCNPHSGSWNPNILSTESYIGQSAGSNGSKRWEPSGFGHVRVPEELKFPNACCVGIASQTSLGIFNPTERWLQVSIGIFSISINGEKMDPLKCQCLVFKNKTIIGPHSTEELKILFLPCHPGIFQCVFSISSWPVSADAETIVQAEALATRVVLTAVAENPNLEVETGKTDGLDFGDLSSGSWKALPLKLINKTHASVPIRLLIKANAVAWRCFTFSKEPVNTFIECSPQTDANCQLAAPSVVNHVIHASYDGQDPEILVVWVLFHAPKKQISLSDILGPVDEFLARVDVEVDSPGPTSVIKSIPLRARAGTARIHAPKDLQAMCLSASVGSSAKQQLPLKNAGNIEVYLKIKTSGQDNCISVEPEDLFLMPGEEQEVAVLFSPKDLKTSSESILKILVLPSGPQYEVVVKGEVNILGNRPLATTSCYSDIPPILSNKQFMAWGGVTLGRTVQQKLTLRNNSPSATQHLRLLIRGQDQNCFQLRNTFGTEERLTSNQELKIRPREDTNIFLMFAPTHVACMLAKLEIKQLGIQSQPGVKFTIPLSGYGGTSNVILENVKKLSDSYMVTLNELLPDKFREVTFRIRNMGSRAAYVKALCFRDLQSKAVMDPKVMIVSPEKFVLKEGTQEVVTVTCNLVEREEMLHKTSTSLLSTICFFCGDEVSRQQYRRAVLYKPEAAKQILPQNSMLRNITFDEEFQGEQLVTEVYDLPQRTNDIELFYGNMRKVILSVVGDSSFKRDCLQQSPGHSLESDRLGSTDTHTNTTLDVLPVKGPQGPPLSLNTDDPVQNKLISRETWAVQPEHLILTSPSISGTAETGHIQIMNNCNRSLKFELSWPAHCLTITPQHGVIEPETSILILVSPNPSLATKSSVFPWSGLIYIHCDNGQKFIKIQIREDIAQDVSSTGSASKKLDVLTPSSESVIHMIKPLPKLPSTKVEIKNRTIFFPETRFGESSENYLEMENNGNEDVRWHLSSFAPPYVKGVDESGDVYRATYTAFRCSRVSGTLGAHGKEKVAIIFLPRDRGDYAQFWDLECHPLAEPHMKHKLRFQLSGDCFKNEAVNAKVSTCALIKTEIPVMPRRRAGSEASTLKTGQNEVIRGVYSREDHYTFLPTRVGESSTLKVNLRNNTFITHVLKFVNPREPFHIRHSKYSLRSQHYINLPVQFKPKSAGRFEGLLVVHIDKYGSLGIRLLGEAHAKE
ncbi:centrosomal protein of 192 kDa [Emys orbicularis]|uniref:centrosomal protein of 192 kDa n=1 Tax=Emys orbicularis TaxID=82168 RepID=UPI0031FBD79C